MSAAEVAQLTERWSAEWEVGVGSSSVDRELVF